MPGNAVGAGGAFTLGENEFAPPGDIPLSVGSGLSELPGGVVVVLGGAEVELAGVVVLVGVSSSSWLQAVKDPMQISETPLARSTNRVVRWANRMSKSFTSEAEYTETFAGWPGRYPATPKVVPKRPEKGPKKA